MTDADADAETLAVRPGVTHFPAYHRPPDGHLYVVPAQMSEQFSESRSDHSFLRNLTGKRVLQKAKADLK